MPEPRICPECHAEIPTDAPPGVCPYCALRAGLRWEQPTAANQQADARSPMAPEDLARRLPELEQFELIGPGGMGTVYKARHRQLDRPVAVKVLHAHLQDDATFAERFTREARTLARLDHPNIVRVYDFGQRGGIYYFVMEFVDGVTLRQTMTSGGVTPAEALTMVPRICEALQYAHDQGVVHRDIKPENILIDQSGAPKIADFGLALLTGSTAETRITQTAQVMGTPQYMAPEQIEHPADVDHRADIYALGVVFYEMLTGELPVGRFPPPSQKVEVDVRLDQVVLRTLEKEPRLRYQQASELSSEVEALSGSEPGPRPEAAGERDRPPPTSSAFTWWPSRYEYRSKRTVWGIPLVHVAFSGDASGQQMALARGIIAIGDAAFGLIALGAFACGGITVSGIGLGLVSLAGISFALLVAIGGVAIGGFAGGSVAIGLVSAGLAGHSVITVSDEMRQWLSLAAWGLSTAIIATVAAGVLAWRLDAAGRKPEE
ncbi:MAG: protein kinase [Dehalococcoidia bacterium]|jgi:tRNA A-37 threonylcarbamoyl transferase component Bud32|nr:protein kinase [Dehalococcoidia bacterium]